MEAKAIPFMDLVDIFDRNGFKSISELAKFPPNPMKWTKKDWHFAVDIVSASYDVSKEEVLKKFRKPGEILLAFNTALRKAGLVIELEQISRISDAELAAKVNSQQWDEEWINPDV